MRKNININSQWKFLKKDVEEANDANYNDSTWEEISLPHTWNNLDGQDGGLDYYRGKCWYRKKINIPESYEDNAVFEKVDKLEESYSLMDNIHKNFFPCFLFRLLYEVFTIIKLETNEITPSIRVLELKNPVQKSVVAVKYVRG